MEALSTVARRNVNGRIHIDQWSFPDSSAGVNTIENGDPGMDPENRLLYRRIRFGVAGDVPPGNMSYRVEIESREGSAGGWGRLEAKGGGASQPRSTRPPRAAGDVRGGEGRGARGTPPETAGRLANTWWYDESTNGGRLGRRERCASGGWPGRSAARFPWGAARTRRWGRGWASRRSGTGGLVPRAQGDRGAGGRGEAQGRDDGVGGEAEPASYGGGA